MKALIMAGALLLALPAGAVAYYRGISLITEGDRIEDVLAKCGRPSARRQGGQPFSLPMLTHLSSVTNRIWLC